MELVNDAKLDKAIQRHPQTRNWLTTWRQAVEAAAWTNLAEVRKMYPAADGVPIRSGQGKLVVTVFNVSGNSYRLLTVIDYRKQRVTVYDVLTHAEYDKEQWKNR
ncbi:MAG: type II toxin-antitoxin system HigB family toxin [Phycisphaerales bacterium]|nr:type II toxin-antitoxin system HigB family toxin [Phycisphaerales bacterium]